MVHYPYINGIMECMLMKILILGDVSRASSCHYLKENLRKFIRENGVEFTIVNGENSAENNGSSRCLRACSLMRARM